MGDMRTIGFEALGGGIVIAAMLLYGLIKYRRGGPNDSTRPCPLCRHIRAGHDSLGCTARVNGSMGSQRCPCNAKYGEPR